MKKLLFLLAIPAALTITGCNEKDGAINTNTKSNTESNTNTESNSTNHNNESEETSKNAYRQGYSDGQMGFGLPASDRASAMESYMAHGYNFSSADVYVYEMGYNDGMYGRSKQY